MSAEPQAIPYSIETNIPAGIRFADDAALKAIDAEVKRIVADAAEFARTSPEPDPAELYTDVYLEAAQ